MRSHSHERVSPAVCINFINAVVLCAICCGGAAASPPADGGKQGLAMLSDRTAEATVERMLTEVGSDSHKGIKLRMVVNATANSVWHAICDNNDNDPDVKYSKITRISDTERLLEQKYGAIPFLGSTTCVLRINEDHLKRIDYELVRSDCLSKFAGMWVLSPGADGKSTIVEVSNQIKLKFPMPQKIVDSFAKHKLKSRALLVKKTAEAAELHIVDASVTTTIK
ncbi:MAG: hypothetical protein K2W95_19175 [Candidatus Obscuribacterales bacterium]|nr:hypothetical protein [Candidatus Obscuribacterales bacterium]